MTSKQIILRPYQESDRASLAAVIREAWEYDSFCSSQVAEKMAHLYLDACLANQTFTQVAVVDGEPAGVIMGKNIARHRCPLRLRWQMVKSTCALLASEEGRRVAKIFSGIEALDQALLDSCQKEYEGELAFFAISQKHRGVGLGRRLFETVVADMRAEGVGNFYLFTDTSCNYRFYEHLGLERQTAHTELVDLGSEKEKMTFFVYDYDLKAQASA
ncbi:MAG: GNAT family N-acetyltransferase [Peptococcaceae bacterium]|nr:GNAT family N-acetyltransferase [Peptococcaceae bacterium]